MQRIAITHLHWDHILGYPAFVWGSWTKGRTSLEVVGPAGTAVMHDQLVERFYRNQAEWAIELGYRREGWDDIQVRDVDHGWSAEWHGAGSTPDSSFIRRCPLACLPLHHERPLGCHLGRHGSVRRTRRAVS